MATTTPTSWVDSLLNHKSSTYVELTILTIMVFLGCGGNIKVMWTFGKVKTQFARQIMSLFFTLAISDGLICSVRIPLRIYGLLHPSWDEGHEVCTAWHITSAILGIIIFKNLLVALQRLIIMYSFPFYRRHFTLTTVLLIVVLIWVIHIGTFITITVVFNIKLSYDNNGICQLKNAYSSRNETVWFIVEGLISVTPVTLTALCHMWIVYKICSTGLTKLDRIDERASYVRINTMAILRTLLVLVCWVPYLLVNMLGADPDPLTPRIRGYLDYLLCAQSVISPYITLQDSDFSDSVTRKKTIARRGILNGNSFRLSLKKCISNITSGELRTNRPTE
ncbi:neuromedin-U receptor 2-like [Mizuhopecten yessoensis]|nr:neuromedin-U receptor 2-like [Mizuhopecten yessoensis]